MRVQGGKIKRPTPREARRASDPQELSSKPLAPEDKTPRKVKEMRKQRRREISR